MIDQMDPLTLVLLIHMELGREKSKLVQITGGKFHQFWNYHRLILEKNAIKHPQMALNPLIALSSIFWVWVTVIIDAWIRK